MRTGLLIYPSGMIAGLLGAPRGLNSAETVCRRWAESANMLPTTRNSDCPCSGRCFVVPPLGGQSDGVTDRDYQSDDHD